jgi:uncharacterized protein (DUF2147 family)
MKIWAFLAIFMMVSTTAFGLGPDDLLGQWYTDGQESKLEFFKCGEKVCVRIAWLKEPNYTDKKEGPVGTPKVDQHNPDPAKRSRPLLGLQIMEGFTSVGDNRWEGGKIYNPETGKIYHGKLQLLSPTRLKLRGYIGISLIGGNEILTR